MVEIPNKVHQTNNTVLAKLEYFNPTHSLKDRIAIGLIEDAEKKGLINRKTKIIEPTSGNMGISLAFVCSIKGYDITLVMPENMSEERKKLIKYFGGNLVLTAKELGFQGAISKSHQLKEEYGNAVVLDQYNNSVNFNVHYNTTAKEIFEQTNQNIDCFVAGAGTGACISAVSKYIKERKELFTICVEPVENNILAGGDRFSPHALQGIGPNFVPNNFKKEYINEITPISKTEAYEGAKMLTKCGIPGGVSSGAVFSATMKHLSKFENQTVCFLVADFCERYASSDLLA
jgi:cysteine synthase A